MKFKLLKHDIEVAVKPAWGSNKRLIILPANSKQWKWNGSLENPSIEKSIDIDYKGSRIHFFLRNGEVINCGDGVDVKFISIKEYI